MYWFWYFLMAWQPWLMLLGMFGILGKEAERAANDLAIVVGLLVLVIAILAGLYFLFHSIAVALGYGFVISALI